MRNKVSLVCGLCVGIASVIAVIGIVLSFKLVSLSKWILHSFNISINSFFINNSLDYLRNQLTQKGNIVVGIDMSGFISDKDQKIIEDFIIDNYKKINRTTLRYIIEKMDDKKRKKILSMKC